MTKLEAQIKPQVIYQVSDSHGQNDVWPLTLLDYHDRHHSNLPMTVVHTGDLFNLSTEDALSEDKITDKYHGVLCNPSMQSLMHQCEFFHTWDDWDFGGDNSNRSHTTSRGLVRIDRDMLLRVRREMFPFPPADMSQDHIGWCHATGGSLILAPDSRSHKEPVAVTNGTLCRNLLNGSGTPHIWGEEQWGWIIEALTRYAEGVERIFLISPTSWVDNLGTPTRPCDGAAIGIRDSVGIFHKHWRNEFMKQLLRLGCLHKLVVWSGDDHTPLVRKRDFWHKPYNTIEEVGKRDKTLDGHEIWEFKAGNGGSTTRIFDSWEHPPVWWGGLKGDCPYQKPEWGIANSRHSDIGYCWKLRKDFCEVSAILLEPERTSYGIGQLPRPAGHVFWTHTL